MADFSKSPRVSVIIPAHNESGSVEHTVRAVLGQEYPDFEVIVVDNASTDDTGAVAERLGARVVREPRKGILFAKEAGRRAATGEIIAGLDADCVASPDWIRKGVSYFTKPDIVAVTGGYIYDDISPFMRTFIKWGFSIVQTRLNALMQWRRHGAYMIGGNCFIRAAALEKIGDSTPPSHSSARTQIPQRAFPRSALFPSQKIYSSGLPDAASCGMGT